MSKKGKKPKVLTWRDKKPEPIVVDVVAEPVRAPTQEELLEVRADLVAIQLNEHHARIRVGKHVPPSERVYSFMVCPTCPAKAVCEAASLRLSDLESRYFARTS